MNGSTVEALETMVRLELTLSEAGALRARVESLTSAASRARSLIEEADDLRSDSGFAKKVERAAVSHPPPPPPPATAESSDGPVPLPRPTRKR